MDYDEATPTPLKFLISNGDLVDESGNVIAHSDSLEDMYEKASPQVKKYLLSDGSVVNENGEEIIQNEYFKNLYDQAEPKVAKYLHADGTIDENPGVVVEPSFDYPSWLTENDELQSIVPDGVKCVARNEGDGTEEIIEGDGVSSLASLINNASNFSAFYATYGESVVFGYSE